MTQTTSRVICDGCGGLLGRTEGEYDRLFDTDCGHDVEDCKRECMGSIGDDGWCKAIVSCEVLIDMIYA